jgi:integrase
LLKGLRDLRVQVGWRLSEIAKLTWSQVDRTAGIVRLEVGEIKNNEARTGYLDEELKAIFERQWDLTKKLLPFVFLSRTGNDRIKRFDKVWEKACRDAKIGVIIFHDLRRTAVRNLVRNFLNTVSSRPKGEILVALADPKISRYARNDKYVTEFMKRST